MVDQRSCSLTLTLLAVSALVWGLACNSNPTTSSSVSNKASAEAQSGVRTGATVRWAEGPSLSPPLSLIANVAIDAEEGGPDAPLPRPIGGRPVPNFVEKNIDRGSRRVSPDMPPIITNFAGLGFGFPGFSASGTPPDTNGDVGPNHYVHIVNSSYVVLDKNDGHVLAGPLRINIPFAGFTGAGGACATTNQGDPLIRYDSHADRWVISQLTPAGSFGGGPHWECVAVSRTGDPTMSSQWYRYAFGPYTVQGGGNALNDYPKTAVWPDGYYTTYNMFTAASGGFRGAKFTVWDRAAMVAGFPALEIDFQTFSDPHGQDGYGGALPSDWDGRFFPPANAPNLVISDDNTPAGPHGMGPVLQVWKIHADWINPDQSTITDIAGNCPSAVLTGPCPILVPANDFKVPCNNFETTATCVPQLGTNNRLDTLGDRLMFRLSYRNFPGNHESILVTRSVDPGTNAPIALRWYELQNPVGGTFADGQRVMQQATYAPGDGKYRWMMSMAQDHLGNMAVGMSESSANIYPEIWIAGRKFDDPPSTLPQDEVQMFQGTSYANDQVRWGDYSMMTVDPTDDCTFYYTQEYIAAPQTSDFNYSTRVASFKFDGCQANEDNYQFEMPDRVNVGTSTTFNITKRHSDGTIDDQYNGTADLRTTDPRVQGLPASITFTAGRSDNVPATFLTTGFRSVIATDHTTLTWQGWGNTIVDGGPPATLAVLSRFPAHLRSGSAGSVTFVAHDALGNIASGYTGTANVTYSDPNATGPATLTFVNGIGELLNVTMISMGDQTITVSDPAQPELTTTANTTIDPYKYFFSNVPTMPTAGQSFSFHLQARDRMNRQSAAYTNRQVRLSASSDPRAQFPATVTFTNGDADVSPATLFLAGGRTPITATDTLNALSTSNTNAQTDIGQPLVSPAVQPAATSTFTLRQSPTVDFPTALTNGTSVTATCASRDPYGNITTANVTVHFTSDDPNADLPADATLVNGQRSGLVFTFHSDSTRHVTITQVDDPSIRGTTAGTYVHPDHIDFDAISGQTCSNTNVHATARLANGSVDTTYHQLNATPSSSDQNATFNPTTVTFTSGQATFAASFHQSGNPTVTLRDAILTTFTATSSPANVTLGPVTTFGITGLGSSVTAGTALSLTVSARDCAATRNDYAGRANVTSNDTQASLPTSPVQFTGGTATVSATLKTAGTGKTVTVQDVSNGSVTATVSTTVNAAPTSSLVFNGIPATAQSGSAVTFSLSAKDAYNNATTDATVHFTSDDPQATLPADRSFAGSGGTVSNLSATFNTAGNHTITATKVGGGASVTSTAVNVTGTTQQPPQNQASSTGGCSAAAGGASGPFALMGLLLAAWHLARGERSRRRRAG